MTVLRHPNNQGVTLQQWRKTAAGGETSLSGTDDFSAGLAYTVGAEEVFINGVLIERGVDYTATSGTAITLTNALVAGDLATVQSATYFNVANAIPKATVTAKGDVIVGTGASTITNLAVGSDGSTLVANSSASTGLSWTTPAGSLANPIINGAQDIWQRGTSIAFGGSNYQYMSDRWRFVRGSFSTGGTVSRQATGDTTNLPNIQYCARVQRDSGNTSTQYLEYATTLETANAIPFVGKAVTFSFYARAGANFSATSSSLSVTGVYGTGTDQSQESFTSRSGFIATSTTLTTTWQRFAFTGTISSSATEIGFVISYTPTGTAGANDYFEVTGVQLDLGTYTAATAPAFRRSGGTLQGELCAAQRYYARIGNFFSPYEIIGQAYVVGTTASKGVIKLPVTMRTSPILDFSNICIAQTGTASYPISAVTIADGGNNYVALNITNSSQTAYPTNAPVVIYSSAGYGWLGFSAEL